MRTTADTSSAQRQAVISQLFIYPVKSCAPLAVAKALLTDQGLAYDRHWMVVDERGHGLSQREQPRLALVQPQLRGQDLVLRAPGMLALHLSLQGVESPSRVHLWDEAIDAWDMGPLAAQWFSDFLGQPCRVARFDPEVERASDRRWTGGHTALNTFSDGFPLLAIGQASLDELNVRLQAQGQAAVGMQRFRPNIVLAPAPGQQGLPQDEDWQLLRVRTATGWVELRPVKPCERCTMVDIDPETGQRSPGVLQALTGYRRHPRLDGGVSFGMNLVALSGWEQELGVGQDVLLSTD